MAKQKALGKADRKGITAFRLAEMFPTEDAAREWFRGIIWPDGQHCPRYDSTRTRECS